MKTFPVGRISNFSQEDTTAMVNASYSAPADKLQMTDYGNYAEQQYKC
ncbi:MAG: hypothetical protein KF746_14755 [Chitinophagaceae bacterium]|nr:hypothetical protein [Chitinophagaceae bacterium]